MRTLALLFLTTLACFGQGFSDASAPFLLSTSSLRKGLVGYWRLEETSGTRYDCSSQGYVLTQVNGVGQAAGKVGNCATFNASLSQYLSQSSGPRTSSNAFTVAAWVEAASFPGSMIIVGRDGGSPNAEWDAWYNSTSQRFRFSLWNNTGSIEAPVNADALGIPVATNWYLYVGWHDPASGTVNIQINNGTVNSATNKASSFTVTNSPAALNIARYAGGAYWNGYIDECGIWNRVLSLSERTQLYNSGKGTHFPWAHP